MVERKTFLDTLQTTIRQLEKEGIITKEQLEEKINVPIEWLYSSGIDRKVLTKTMDNICKMINPVYKNSVKREYAIDHIRISERLDRIIIEVPGRDDWTYFCLSDEKFHKKGKIAYFSSEEFIQEIHKTMREAKQERLRSKIDSISTEDLTEIISVMFDQRQKENELKGLSISLSEMIENFGEYYKYLCNEKQQIRNELQEEVQIISGGLIEQDIDQRNYGSKTNGELSEKTERKNEIYPFEERDEIFRRLKPIKIISFDSIDENRQVQKGTYMSYVYKNNRENGGYFLISEPYQGDKSCRAVYLTEEYIENMQDGEKNSSFWVDIARAYLEMSGQEFHDENGTYTFKHRALDTYAARMKYIVSGEVDKNVSKSVIYSAKMNLAQLFGIEINKGKLGKIVEGVTKSEIDAARAVVTPRTLEKNVGGRE